MTRDLNKLSTNSLISNYLDDKLYLYNCYIVFKYYVLYCDKDIKYQGECCGLLFISRLN